MGFDHARDGLNFLNFVIFVFIELLTTFCVLKFMPATPLVFALYLNQIAVRVILVDFYCYIKPFHSFRMVVPTTKITNSVLSACMQRSTVFKE